MSYRVLYRGGVDTGTVGIAVPICHHWTIQLIAMLWYWKIDGVQQDPIQLPKGRLSIHTVQSFFNHRSSVDSIMAHDGSYEVEWKGNPFPFLMHHPNAFHQSENYGSARANAHGHDAKGRRRG